MSLFDKARQAAGNLAGGLTSGMSPEHAQLVNSVLEMLTSNQSGGLSGLLQGFHDKGLGDIASSWVGTGQNLPISAEQIEAALGTGQVQQLAAKAGITPDVAKAKLAEILPTVVDKLTPDGKVPEGGLLEQALSFMKSKLPS